jgi:hypothetical protein
VYSHLDLRDDFSTTKRLSKAPHQVLFIWLIEEDSVLSGAMTNGMLPEICKNLTRNPVQREIVDNGLLLLLLAGPSQCTVYSRTQQG